MSEAWYKEYCPFCNIHNWVCNGDVTDLSSMDVEGVKCRKCKKVFPLGYTIEEATNVFGTDNFEDINWEDGLENPT